MSHAYYVTGDLEKGVEEALRFVEKDIQLPVVGNPDVAVMRYGLLSVEDARSLADFARQAPLGEKRAVVVVAGRLFHEAQNALLKLFEEPAENTFLILVVPSEGIIVATLRSRMTRLSGARGDAESARAFLRAGKAQREKLVAKLLERTKSDNEEEKQTARQDAVALAEGLIAHAYAALEKKTDPELTLFLKDMNAFMPMLHDRAAPLKLIFEHILLVLPQSLVR